MPHFAPDHLLSRQVSITLAGCGGNGSQMLTGLARLEHALRALGHPGFSVVAFDPDEVSEANMGRQLFSPADVGINKATVLVHRINSFFGLRWNAQPRALKSGMDVGHGGIVISCVDSTKARSVIREVADSADYLLDLGNRAVDGQVIFGQADEAEPQPRPGHVPLPHPYDLFPELVDVNAPQDDAPSCGLAEALERQELFINQAVVTPALSILWEFFRHGRLTWHGAFVNLRTGSTRPLNIKENQG